MGSGPAAGAPGRGLDHPGSPAGRRWRSATLHAEHRRWPAVILGAASGTTLLFLALGLATFFPGAARFSSVLVAGVQTVAIAVALRVVLRRPLALATLGEFLTYFAAVGGGALIAASLFWRVCGPGESGPRLS